MRPACAPNLELTVENASMEKGANVFLWDINSNWHTQPSHQKWRISRVEENWYKIEAENSGLALNIHNGISANGTNVSVWPFGGNMHQFIFFKTGDGYYFIQGRVLGSFMLDVENAGSVPGTNVSIHEYNGSNAQKWKLVKVNGATSSVTPTPGSITQTTKEIAQRYATVYTNAELTAKQSNRWIGKGEEYTVVREYEKSLEVQYYSSKGEPRSGFVNKNIREAIPVGDLDYKFNELRRLYPNRSKWTGSYKVKNEKGIDVSVAWTCHGFAFTLGRYLSGTDTRKWNKVYDLTDLQPGDIVRCYRPHTFMITKVEGDYINFVDCNSVEKDVVRWCDETDKDKYGWVDHYGGLEYVLKYPR